jgi:hypothetical protein
MLMQLLAVKHGLPISKVRPDTQEVDMIAVMPVLTKCDCGNVGGIKWE